MQMRQVRGAGALRTWSCDAAKDGGTIGVLENETLLSGPGGEEGGQER